MIEKIVLIITGGLIGFSSSIAKDYFIEKSKRKNKELEIKRLKLEELYVSIVNRLDEKTLNMAMFKTEYIKDKHIANKNELEKFKNNNSELIKLINNFKHGIVKLTKL